MRKVVITGFAPDSRKLSPVWKKSTRKGYECWSFNNDLEQAKFATRHFEMHELDVYGKKAVDDAVPDSKYLDALHKGLGIPVYHLRADKSIPGVVAYPIKALKRFFQTDYFTNSISYMLALAIYEKVDEIHVYGVDMALQHESAWERPSIEYFLGFARGMGVRLVIPDQSDLLKCMGLYGYEPTYEYMAAMRDRLGKMKSARERYEQASRNATRDADFMAASVAEMDFWLRQWAHPGDSAFKGKGKARKAWLMQRSGRYRDEAKQYWKTAGQIDGVSKKLSKKAKILA